MLLRRRNFTFSIPWAVFSPDPGWSPESLPTTSLWRAMAIAQVLLQLYLEPNCEFHC